MLLLVIVIYPAPHSYPQSTKQNELTEEKKVVSACIGQAAVYRIPLLRIAYCITNN
jgi:hypothetical protein